MRSLISLVTTASLVLHFGIGCCAHHSHSHDGQVFGAVVNLDHDHGADERSLPVEHSGPADEECQEPSCVFLAGVKITLTKDLAPAGTTIALTERPAQLDCGSTRSCRVEADTGDEVPVRRHLYYQVLLI